MPYLNPDMTIAGIGIDHQHNAAEQGLPECDSNDSRACVGCQFCQRKGQPPCGTGNRQYDPRPKAVQKTGHIAAFKLSSI